MKFIPHLLLLHKTITSGAIRLEAKILPWPSKITQPRPPSWHRPSSLGVEANILESPGLEAKTLALALALRLKIWPWPRNINLPQLKPLSRPSGLEAKILDSPGLS